MGLIILGVALLAITGTIWYFYRKIKRFARQNFGTDSLQDIIQTQEELLENTPKSVSGMTSLYLPRLQADFPELNWIAFRSSAERHLLQHLTNSGITSPHIHQTELRDYRKNAGTCYVIFQSSVEYYKDEKKIQNRFNTTFTYIQDAARTGHEEAYSMNCPNCGAPVVQLGNKVCEYCGSTVHEVNMRVWTPGQVEEG